jgi:transcriptional regulator with GAF, ATPase, and Fis domain
MEFKHITTINRKEPIKEAGMLSKKAIESFHFNPLVGNSEVMLNIQDLIDTVAPTNAPVLIVGETGTGKELVAKTIHHRSLRRDKPFVAVNCPALVENLWQSEVFGHERGSFTGAIASKQGKFEIADKGTFFLMKFQRCPWLFRPNY